MSDNQRGVFVSWSKQQSAEIAMHIKPFLEDVLGNATIFMSQAMEGGTRWSMEIPQHLEACNAGLILVTEENSHEPWLQFEAGALSKNIDESRVIPLLCNAAVGDIQGTPLSLFQAKKLDHDGLLSVCVLFGTAFSVSEDTVRRRFELSWPKLEAAVAKVKRSSKPAPQLTLADLMAVMERLAGQVASIESAVKISPRNALAFSPTGGSTDTLRALGTVKSNTELGEILRQIVAFQPTNALAFAGPVKPSPEAKDKDQNKG